MRAKSVNGIHRLVWRVAYVVLLLILLSSLGWRAGFGTNHSIAAPSKQKYMIMLTVSKDSTLEKTLDQEFLAAIKQNPRTIGLNVFRSGKPWEDTQTCKHDPSCDRLSIQAEPEKRFLLITCGTSPLVKIPGPPCSAAPALYQEKCLETLPQAFIDVLWNHSKAFHERENK